MNRDHTLRRFRALLLFSGIFNIVLAAPLMLPGIYTGYFALLWHVNVFLSLGGRAPVPPAESVNALLINTAGIDLVLIGVFVLYAARDPLLRWFIPAANAAGRTMFAGVALYYGIAYDIAGVVLLIAVVDILISGAFTYHLFALRSLLAWRSMAPKHAHARPDASGSHWRPGALRGRTKRP